MAGAPVVAVSSVRRRRARRPPCGARRPARPGRGPATGGCRGATGRGVRLAVDRVFSVKGRGTGRDGIAPGRPDGAWRPRSVSSPAEAQPGRARSRSTAGSVDAVDDGGRVALNLAGRSDDATPIRGDRPHDRPGRSARRSPAGDPPPPAELEDRPGSGRGRRPLGHVPRFTSARVGRGDNPPRPTRHGGPARRPPGRHPASGPARSRSRPATRSCSACRRPQATAAGGR